MSNGSLPFSLDFLLEQCGGSKAVVRMVLDEFLTQARVDTADMEAGLASGDLPSAAKAAHRLKGTAGTIGAEVLHPLCASMEQACKEGRSEAAAAICLRLKEEARRCADAVPDAKMKVN